MFLDLVILILIPVVALVASSTKCRGPPFNPACGQLLFVYEWQVALLFSYRLDDH